MNKEMPWSSNTVTFTKHGAIPHLLCSTATGQRFYAPVKLNPIKAHNELPRPEKRGSKMVYALPGGLEVVA